MNINLMIDGLAGYLPQPFETPQRVRILFPHVRTEEVRDEITVCKHFPKMIVSGEAQPWDLAGEHIEITGGEGSIVIDPEFLAKVSDMAQIAHGSHIVDPGYLADPPQPPEPNRVPLAAELTLTSGTCSVTMESLTPPMAFREKPDSDAIVDGEFAGFVHIQIEVPGGTATLVTKRFGDQLETRRKTFTGEPDEVVDIVISNRCDRMDDPNRPDRDFIIYYDLSHRNYQGPKPIPYPLPLPSPSAPGANGTAFREGGCIAAAFRE